jgi:putative SOS response-associated peptidase YedK
VAAIRAGPAGPEGVQLRWGLVPYWARDVAIGNRLINARAESLADRPAFRDAFHRRHCVVLASGFYEWRQEAHGRTPYYVAPRDGRPLAFAGLWERWDRGATPLETCTLITTEASRALAPLHERMPVILPPEALGAWLDPRQPAAVLARWLGPAPEDLLLFHPVSRAVNSPANEGPGLIAATVEAAG